MDDKIYKSNIKTVILSRDSSVLSYPIMDLSETEVLNLRFDDMDRGSKTYSYTILQCNSDWSATDQPQMWYLTGFNQLNLNNNATYSFGTKPAYTHYSLTFPNAEMRPKYSGNYIIKIFEDYDPDNVVLTRRFMVVEDIVKMDGRIRNSVSGDFAVNSQDVLFKADASMLPNILPQRDLNVVIMQNFRWDNLKKGIKPMFMSGNTLDFSLIDGSNTFEGGNEYRYFDMRTLNIRPDKVYNMATVNDTLNLYCRPEQSRRYMQYARNADLNGNFYISTMDGVDPNLEGNYAKVNFVLAYDKGISGIGEVYMLGNMSGNKLDDSWKMDYDYDKKQYVLSKYLKQGYYNFIYVRKDPAQNYKSDSEFFEGSFSQTENNYLVFIYYRDLMKRCDRIVGFDIINSFRNR